MPLTSVEAAEDWVRSHSVRKPRACIGAGSGAGVAPVPMKAVSGANPSSDSFEAILKDVRVSREQAFKNLQSAQLVDDGIRTGIASKHFSDAVSTELKTVENVTEQRKALGELVSTSFVTGLLNKALQPVVAALDGCAAAMAQRCNPTAPLVAETALREWVNDTKGLVQLALAMVTA